VSARSDSQTGLYVVIEDRPNPALAPGCFPHPGKSTAKVGRYHGTPFHFHSQQLFLPLFAPFSGKRKTLNAAE